VVVSLTKVLVGLRHDELAVGDLAKLSRRHNHASKLKRESKSEKQFFAVEVTAIDSL
jgi:hypothetical protein